MCLSTDYSDPRQRSDYWCRTGKGSVAEDYCLPKVCQRRLISASLEAQEDLRAPEAPSIELSREARGGAFNTGETRGYFFTQGADHNGHISDGGFGFHRFGAHIIKVELLLQRLWRFSQAGNHKVVCDAWSLILHHVPFPDCGL